MMFYDTIVSNIHDFYFYAKLIFVNHDYPHNSQYVDTLVLVSASTPLGYKQLTPLCLRTPRRSCSPSSRPARPRPCEVAPSNATLRH